MFVRIYALAVCFASILCITISLGIGLFDIVQLIYPTLTMNSYEHQSLQSNEHFRQSRVVPRAIGPNGIARPLLLNEGMNAAFSGDTKEAQLSEAEITRLREARMELQVNNVRHDARRSLIQILVMLLVTIPLFGLHWRLARRLDEQGT
ncbi:MAG: hypothetical protein HOC23_11115 [Halieaceae bacterium]|jgi:hypothetical protein|nr:hypothetical protein [Halieaceae bacterium]